MNTFDITAYLTRAEGPHFDRKSLWKGRPGGKRPRPRKEIRDQIAKYIAAFANAEGGVLLLGIEDDATLTGHNLPADAIQTMLQVPVERLSPPQPAGFMVQVDGHDLLAFEVPMAGAPVQVIGDGYPLRMGDSTVQVPFGQIQALKLRGLMQSFEAQPSALRLDALDATLLAQAQTGAGLNHLMPEDYLIQRRLADLRGPTLELRQAAELLFCKGLPEHPNAGIRIFRVVGRVRRTGLEHNVEELPRIEGPLPQVLKETYRTISGLLRRPSRLALNGRFRQTTEYPEFSWKEAILNALGHRDYRVQGRGVEVWLFDDRMEVISPGGLPPDITLERLLSLERVHESRNPRLVRALVDLGFMRDQGEGIPRMFAEMEGFFLPKPEITTEGPLVRLVLRNTMTLTADDRGFMSLLTEYELTEHEFRALLEVKRHGRVDNARIRSVIGLDTLAASHLLRLLRDQGLIEKQGAGSASFYTLTPALRGESTELGPESTELGPESTELGPESTELDPAHAVPEALREEISKLGSRPGKHRLRRIIERLCQSAPRDGATLAAIMQRNPRALRRHLQEMVAEGILKLRFPDQPSHPKQAYITTQADFIIQGDN